MAVTQAQQIPPGAFMHWMGTSPPNGWLLCNGGAISTSYPVLRSIFGTNMPDYQSRFVINASGSFPVGVGGGAYSVALAPGNLPNQLQLATSVGLADAGVKGELTVNANQDAVSVNLTSTQFRGSSAPFSIVPSYIALTLICKAG
jgi:microcystin-dependent protein